MEEGGGIVERRVVFVVVVGCAWRWWWWWWGSSVVVLVVVVDDGRVGCVEEEGCGAMVGGVGGWVERSQGGESVEVEVGGWF